MYDKVEQTGFKILNIRDPRKQTLAVVFVVAIVFGIGFGFAAKLMYDVMNGTIIRQAEELRYKDVIIAQKDSIIDTRDDKHNLTIERFYNKAMGVQEKVNELKDKVAK